jgi:hypothetical protein
MSEINRIIIDCEICAHRRVCSGINAMMAFQAELNEFIVDKMDESATYATLNNEYIKQPSHLVCVNYLQTTNHPR